MPEATDKELEEEFMRLWEQLEPETQDAMRVILEEMAESTRWSGVLCLFDELSGGCGCPVWATIRVIRGPFHARVELGGIEAAAAAAPECRHGTWP
jgi:hypothetical protein